MLKSLENYFISMKKNAHSKLELFVLGIKSKPFRDVSSEIFGSLWKSLETFK